jgi:8-oxo-dGTP pyrophosphatase MutT (NUDIX family)
MKDGTPAWSVVVVVTRGAQNVLAISRNFNTRDPSFPGGDSETTDESPAATAARELFEETGIKAIELRCMDQWMGERGQPVYAFFVPKWKASRLRTSDEGKPFWTTPQRLLIKSAFYRDFAQRLLEKLGRVATRTPAV